MTIIPNTCDYCNQLPILIDNMLYHKCKMQAVIITSESKDIDDESIEKWNKIQECGGLKKLIYSK